MVEALANRLGPSLRPAVLSVVAIALTAAYCLAYNALAGTRESLADALAWGLANVAPWVLAFELARSRAVAVVPALAGAALASLGIEWLLVNGFELGFALIRRVPALAATGAALAGLRLWQRRSGRSAATPFLRPDAREALWIAAAGNYLELHFAAGGTRLVRGTLAQAEAELAAGFVRIHRSLLVNRTAIAAIDRTSLRLTCGKRLPVGSRYRHGLPDS